MNQNGWIGVDFDGTLAQYDGWVDAGHCGAPVPAMVARVKRWLAEGFEVRVFTARIWPHFFAPPGALMADLPVLPGIGAGREVFDNSAIAVKAIRRWCVEYIGQELTITNVKDYAMVELWDDRAVQVEANTGRPVGQSTRGLK